MNSFAENLNPAQAIRRNIMKCKHCQKELQQTLSGLKDFCSYECKKAYRLAYKASWIKSKRNVDRKGGYASINSQNVDTANPYQKPLCEGKNDSLRLSEDNFEGFGGREWYQIAKKHCCNFEMREKEGYCVTLTDPIQTFRTQCRNCSLMQGFLKTASSNTKR